MMRTLTQIESSQINGGNPFGPSFMAGIEYIPYICVAGGMAIGVASTLLVQYLIRSE